MIAEGSLAARIVQIRARKKDLASVVPAAETGEGPALTEADVDKLLMPLE